MSNPTPSPEEARAALAEAARHADRLRLEDQQLRLVLVVIAVLYVATGFLVVLPRMLEPAFDPGPSLVGVLGGGLVACTVLLLRMRAASRWGMARFFWSVAAFGIWNGAVIGISIAIGWWGPGTPGLHFTASTVVGALPLVVAAALMGATRR